MATNRLIQQQLFDLCRNQAEATQDELQLLKTILLEMKQGGKLYLIDTEDETHRAPFFYAIENGKSLDFLRQLLDYEVRLTHRILLGAIRNGSLDILKLLHQYGADFRQSYYNISLLHECILLHKNDLISFLIEQGGVNPDAADNDNQTPLLFAIYRMNIEAMFILLRYSSIDPCSISTRKGRLTSFHAACNQGIDEVLPAMIKNVSKTNINNLSNADQTPFDLFLSCYLFNKTTLEKDEIALKKFSDLFDLFVSNGAKLHHLTKAYRRTRAPYVTKLLTMIFKNPLDFSELILQTGRSTILADFQSLVCQSLGDWPDLVESNDSLTMKQRLLILRQLYELYVVVCYKSINRQVLNERALRRYCFANEKNFKMKQILWIFIKHFTEPKQRIGSLKSICRTKILLNLNSIAKDCTQSKLSISTDLENDLLFLTMQ